MAKKIPSTSEKIVSNDDPTQTYYRIHLVWLDENIEKDGLREYEQSWYQLDEQLKLFTDAVACINYIKKQNDSHANSHIIFVISKSFTQEVLQQIHDCTCIVDIFIFGSNVKNDKCPTFHKVRAVYSNTAELFDRIRHGMERNNVSIGFSLFNNEDISGKEATSKKETLDENYAVQNIKEDQARFVWFYKCSSFMIELNDNNKLAKEEMIRVFCEKYNDKKQLALIKEFENESLDENERRAIWWYTNNSIIYKYINETLVSGSIVAIYSCRFLIKLICQQLKRLHEDFIKSAPTETLRLYRGQRLKLQEILLISKHIHALISLNSFVSTTLNEDIAKRFNIGRSEQCGEPVLFIIDIDMNAQYSTDFADIRKYSRYEEEEEILISIGSVFRIESVEYIEQSKIYKIHLVLKQHDQLTVNEYIEQTFTKQIDSNDQSVLFGKLLFDMGEYKFAIRYYEDQIRCISDSNNHNRPTYLNNLGVCYDETGDRIKALRYFKIANGIYKEIKNERGLGACCHNMANCYYNQKDYDNAKKWALEALNLRHRYPLARASTLDLLGCIQSALHDSEAAFNNIREALEVRLKLLGETNPNHPDIGISYFNLGKLDFMLSSLVDAERNCCRALEIFKVNYAKTHPLIKEVTRCLEKLKTLIKKS